MFISIYFPALFLSLVYLSLCSASLVGITMHEGMSGTIIPDALVGDGWCYHHHEDHDAVAVVLIGVAVPVTHSCVVNNRSAIVAAAVVNSP